MSARAASTVLLLLLPACGGGAAEATATAPPPTAVTAPAPTSAPPPASSAASPSTSAAPPASAVPAAPPVAPPPLAATTTFRELVAAVRAAATSHVVGDCVIEGPAAGPFRLATYDAVAGLDDPPADLDPVLEKRGSGGGMRLVTAWGKSEGGDYLDLVALGPTPKTIQSTSVPVIVATDKGLYLGLLGRPGDGTRLDATTQARVRSELVPKAKVWVVTAEGDAPMTRVREALALIKDTAGTVVLATPSASPGPQGKRISRYDAKVPKGEKYACDSDLSNVQGIAVGNYKMSTLGRLSDAIERASKACGDALPAGRGGAIHVMVRIKADGHIEKSCAETDDLGDETVRACVMNAIGKLKLPAPDEKKGVVPFGMPVMFTGKPVRALCEK